MIIRVCIILLIILSGNSPVNAENGFSFQFELRERFEVWNGMNEKNYGDNSVNAVGDIYDNFLLQRIVTGITFKFSDNLMVSAHLQDSRAFGWSLRQSEYPDLFKVHSKNSTNPH